MKKLLNYAQDYISDMNIIDFALLKFCLVSVGVVIGLVLPQKHKKIILCGAFSVFMATYVPLVVKLIKQICPCCNKSQDL